MNLATLKATCAAYHGRNVTELTKGEVDLFLVAANNARVKAEKRNEFNYSKLTATLVLDGVNGGALSAATIVPADTFKSIRSISSVGALTSAGRKVPVEFSNLDTAIEQDRSALDLTDNGMWGNRYPSDADVEAWQGAGHVGIVQRGMRLYQYPALSTNSGGTIYIEGIGWLKDYTDDQIAAGVDADAQDFFIEFGFEYMQWSIIIELNFFLQTFVQRRDGNVGSPEALRQEAWRDLLLWDSYQIAPNETTTR